MKHINKSSVLIHIWSKLDEQQESYRGLKFLKLRLSAPPFGLLNETFCNRKAIICNNNLTVCIFVNIFDDDLAFNVSFNIIKSFQHCEWVIMKDSVQ